MKTYHRRWPRAAIALASLLAISAPARADSIVVPGFDLFATEPGTEVELDLTPFGGSAGTVIPLTGLPLKELDAQFKDLGDTDTIVKRDAPAPPIGPGDLGTIDIELVALSLVSVDPVDVGGSLFDVEIVSGVLISGQPANPNGLLQIVVHDDTSTPGGGTFNAQLPLDAQITFTLVANPAVQQVVSFSDTLNSTGVSWCHQPSPFYPADPAFPAGGFFAGVACPGGGPPLPTAFNEVGGLNEVHRARPASTIPEPGTALLLLAGMAATARAARRRPAA